MRAFSCPAEYRAFVEAEQRRIVNTIRCDIGLRADASLRHMALVPESEFDAGAQGTCTILVNVSGDPDSNKRIRDLVATGAVST